MIKQIQPFLGQEEADAVYKTVLSTQLTEGPKTLEFEEDIKKYTGYKYALALSNWTDGLILAIEVMRKVHRKIWGRSLKNIIIPDLTFVASYNAAFWCNLDTTVLDVDMKTTQLDPNIVEDYIKKNDNIDSIMLVDLYGSSPDLDAFNTISKKYNVSIIEDAAQALGVKYNGRHVGAYCENSIGGFSLYGNKIITCGEGSVLVTNNDEMYELARIMKSHGGSKRGTFEHEMPGFNFRLDDIRASIAIEQLKKIEHIIASKRTIWDIYFNELSLSYENIFPHTRGKDIRQNCWFFNILFDNAEEAQRNLKKLDIETRRIFKPLHKQICYQTADHNSSFNNIKFNNSSEFLYMHGLSLPTYPQLTIDEIKLVIDAVNTIQKESILDDNF